MKIIKEISSISFNLEFNNYCDSKFINKDKVILFGNFNNNYLTILDIVNNNFIYQQQVNNNYVSNYIIAMTPNGKYLVYLDEEIENYFLFESETLNFYEISKDFIQEQEENMITPSVITSDNSNYFLFIPNANYNINDEYISLFEISSKTFIRKIKFPQEVKNSIWWLKSFREKTKQLIFISPKNGYIHFYNIDTEKTEKILEFYYQKRIIHSMSFSNDYKYLACVTDSMNEEFPTIIIWDIESGEIIREIFEENYGGLGSGSRKICLTPHVKYLLVEAYDKLIIYEFETGIKIKIIEPAFCSTISQDGKYLGYSDGKSYKVFEIE